MAQTTFSITDTADDGYVEAGDAAYPPATPTGASSGTDTAYTMRHFDGANYGINNTCLRFDTSSLPDGATVTGATLRVYVINKGDANSRSISADWYVATVPIDGDDWLATAATDAHAGTAISSITTSADNDFALTNVSNVSLSGTTGLRLHISGGVPTGYNYVGIATLDHASLTEPRLIVDYSEVETQSFYASRRRSWR